VVLFGAAGALGVLFVQEKDRTAGLSKQVEGKDRDIEDLNRKVKESKEDATRAVDLQKQAEAGQKKAEAEAASSQKCRDAARALRAAALANDEPKGQAAGVEIFTHC
jgi:membrane protein involved in colicin uptake